MWLVERKVFSKADLELWRGVYKGQTAKDIAERIVAQYRPEPDDANVDKSDTSFSDE